MKMIVVEGERGELRIERVEHWAWKWRVDAGDISGHWHETFWRIGPYLITWYARTKT